MANYFDDNQDLRYYFEQGIDWTHLANAMGASTDAEELKSTFGEILDVFGKFAAEEIAPRAAMMDQKGTRMENGAVVVSEEHEAIFRQLQEMGVYGICTPEELGGMGCPGLLYLMIIEMVARSDISTMTHYAFHVATAVTLLTFSVMEGSTEFDANGKITKTRWQEAIADILAGRAWGSMDLTEPGAGSDLAALRTFAERDGDGVWRVTGNKVFITSGHGQYHLVLAKTAKQERLDALSLFLVRKDQDGRPNIHIDRVEDKLGHHGSPTCSVTFERAAAELIGKEGDGFRLMLKLMNHARLGVSVSAIGMCEAAHRCAQDYAATRVSMGTTLDRQPMIADYLDAMDITIRGLRALAMEAAFYEETAMRHELRPAAKVAEADAHRALRRARHKVRKWTPLLKYYAAEKAVEMARMAAQIHGGNGYTVDYPPERFLRDALVLPVYEGTSQIQALMALKDNLGGAVKNPQRFLRKVAATKLAAITAIDPVERRVLKLESMALAAQQSILWRVAKSKWSGAVSGGFSNLLERLRKNWDPKRDFAFGQLHAEHLTELLTLSEVAKVLWQQAQRHPARMELVLGWLDRHETRVQYLYECITTTGDRVLEKLASAAKDAKERVTA
jgi:alkylation response protein AidB-like acyl-CoA dehydrogenase